MIALVVALMGVTAMIAAAVVLIRATAPRRRPWSDRTTACLAGTAVVWTVLVGGVLLLAPFGTESSSSSGSSGAGPGSTIETTTTTTSSSLLQQEGAPIVAVLLVPVAIALVGALGTGAASRRRRVGTGWVLLAFCTLGAATLGFFYLPAAVALLTAGLKTHGRQALPTTA